MLQNEAPLHRVHRGRLAEAVATWKPRLRHLPRPYFAVLVGGGSGPLPPDGRRASGSAAGQRTGARRHGGSLLITTSARTPASALAGLASALDAPHYLFGWKKGRAENPYYAFLGLAEEIVVTADSVSMIAEACATAKPVHLFDLGEGPPSMRAPLGLDGEPSRRCGRTRGGGSDSPASTAMYRSCCATRRLADPRHPPRPPALRGLGPRLLARRGRARSGAAAALRPRPGGGVRALLAGSDIARVAVLDRAA